MDFTPKITFAKGPSAQAWTDVASSILFREAVSTAMLQMQANQGYAKLQTEAMANAYQLEGARAFLTILMNLTAPPQEPVKRPQSENLKHDV